MTRGRIDGPMNAVTVEVASAVAQLRGLACTQADNPHGSILLIDLGPLAVPEGLPAEAPKRGYRSLTIFCPWRLETATDVLGDWNGSGSTSERINQLLSSLVGVTVADAQVFPPSGDLRINFSNGTHLIVFVDSNGEAADDAWSLLGTDGLEVVVQAPRNST